MLWAALRIVLTALGLSRPSLLSRQAVADIESILSTWNTAGAGIAIVTSPKFGDGWHNETRGFGKATATKSWDEHTLFGIASNSKLFTAMAIGMLVDNGTALPGGGTLDYSTKLKDVLPGWQLMDPVATDLVDLEDLLSMRSGLPRHDGSFKLSSSPAEIVASLRHLKPSAELRQHWQYNNLHYTALSHIVPTLTGVEFIDHVQTHILDPLGMTSTTYNSSSAIGRRVDGHTHVPGVDAPVPIDWWTDGDGINDAGPGGVVTSLHDLTIWLRELLEPTILPLSRAATPLVHIDTSPDPELGLAAYGHAQRITSYRSHRVVQHTGGIPGQVSIILRLPDVGIGLAVLLNDDSEARVFEAIAYRILDDLLGLEPIDWSARFRQRRATPPTTPLPASPRPPTASVGGRYTHPVYPSLDLEPFNRTAHGDVLAHLDHVNVTGPVYVSGYGAAFTASAVLTHFDGDYWNCSFLSQPAAGLFLPAQAFGALATDRGIGLFGNVWGQGPGMPVRQPYEGEARAEVWLGKADA